jgi:hypothetical protein
MSKTGRFEADDVIATALAAGKPIAQAAKEGQVCTKTVRRRLDDPDFRRKVDRLKAEAVSQGVALLGRSVTGAAVELARLLKSDDEKIRLQAAKEIVGLTLKARQLTDLERRVDDLEGILHGDGSNGPDHPTDKAGDAGEPAAGPDEPSPRVDPGGPGGPVPAGGDHPGHVADESAPIDGDAGVTPLFEAGG